MKRISILVMGAHIAALLWMALWMPGRIIPKKPLIVRTVMEVATPVPTAAPAATQKPIMAAAKVVKKPAPIKKTTTPAPKPIPRPKPKAVARPVQQPKSPAVPAALMKQLEMSIAKIEDNGQKQVSSPLKRMPKLQIDTESDANASIYAANLVQCLQSALTLPSVGAVKVELTLRNDGTFVKMRILNSQSNPNKAFLETHLVSMKYPAFSGELKKEQEHAFVVTFCNN